MPTSNGFFASTSSLSPMKETVQGIQGTSLLYGSSLHAVEKFLRELVGITLWSSW